MTLIRRHSLIVGWKVQRTNPNLDNFRGDKKKNLLIHSLIAFLAPKAKVIVSLDAVVPNAPRPFVTLMYMITPRERLAKTLAVYASVPLLINFAAQVGKTT